MATEQQKIQEYPSSAIFNLKAEHKISHEKGSFPVLRRE